MARRDPNTKKTLYSPIDTVNDLVLELKEEKIKPLTCL